MKAKEIRDLIDFISNSGLAEVNIETEEFKIAVKKNSSVSVVENTVQSAPAPARSSEAPAQQANAPAAASSGDNQNSNLLEIKSPMIGTFYESPNPEAGPFVKVGDMVKQGQTVCIVEAMKLFNEIESEVSGKVVKILVDNASPVEFDQPLFLVEPA